jgi:hypothetical protein
VSVRTSERHLILMRCGLGVHRRRRKFMGNGVGVSQEDRNRNARLDLLRGWCRWAQAIVGIDLADSKQMVSVTTTRGCSRVAPSAAAPEPWVLHSSAPASEHLASAPLDWQSARRAVTV